jgi:hypothetical protein
MTWLNDKNRTRTTLEWLLYLVVLWVIAFPNGRGTLFSGLSIYDNPREVVEKFGYADVASYVRGGIDLADDWKMSEENFWLLRLWPPGQFYLIALLIAIFGTNVSIVLSMAALILPLWATVLVVARRLIADELNQRTSIYFVLAAFALSPISGGLIGNGLPISDSVGTAFASMSLLCVVAGLSTVSARARFARCFLSGSLLGIAAYIRNSFELVGLALTGLLIFVVALIALAMILKRLFSRFTSVPTIIRMAVMPLVAFVLAFHALTIPWRLVAAQTIKHSDYSWSVADEIYWEQRWMPNQVFEEKGFGWLKTGAANSACRIDLEKCQRILEHEMATGAPYSGAGYSQAEFRKMAIETYKSRPIALAIDRSGIFLKSWFGFGEGRSPMLLFAHLFSLACFVLTTVASLLLILRKTQILRSLIFLVSVAALAAPFLIMHIEYRYLDPIKVYSILLAPLQVGALLQSSHNNRTVKTLET